MKFLVLCAGLGTRLKPLTDEIPKCMVMIAGKPVLEHLVDHIRKYYPEATITINVHHKAEKVMEYFGDKLIYIHEPILLGDLVSTKRIKDLLGGGLIVMNGDTLTDLDLRKIVQDGMDEVSSIASFDGMTYTGTTYFSPVYPNKITLKEYGCEWIDIGTVADLKRAREKYESEANLSKLL